MRRLAPASYAYRFEYADGLKASIIQFQGRPRQQEGGVVGDCSVAARLKGNEIFSVLFYLPYYTMRNFFSPWSITSNPSSSPARPPIRSNGRCSRPA